MTFRSVAALLLALACGAEARGQVARQPAARVYVVDRIRDLISEDEKVGTRKAGLMCLPNGSLRWKDVSTGANIDQREIVQDVLEDRGLRVASLGAPGPTRRQVRLRGILKAADFTLCARDWLGDHNALSGNARLEIEWRAEEVNGAEADLRHVSAIRRHFDRHDAASLGAIYRLLLEEAAKDLADWLPTVALAP